MALYRGHPGKGQIVRYSKGLEKKNRAGSTLIILYFCKSIASPKHPAFQSLPPTDPYYFPKPGGDPWNHPLPTGYVQNKPLESEENRNQQGVGSNPTVGSNDFGGLQVSRLIDCPQIL